MRSCNHCGAKYEYSRKDETGYKFCCPEHRQAAWEKSNFVDAGPCEICGETIRCHPSQQDTARFCSGECKTKSEGSCLSKTERMCARSDCENTFIPSESGRRDYCCDEHAECPYGPFICNNCGKEYYAKAPDRDTCCSRKCGFQYLAEQRLKTRSECAALKRIANNIAGRYFDYKQVGKCVVCGTPFLKPIPTSKRCSEACKQEHDRRWANQSYTSRPGIEKKCEVCGSLFTTGASYDRRRNICDDCLPCHESIQKAKRSGKDRMRAEAFDVDYEPVDRMLVFQRDEWRCQHCGVKCRPDWSHNHDRYPTLDHIIPMSKGGGHVYHNVQCLCRKCNTEKGISVECEQTRLAFELYTGGPKF